ncbi:MAG TPA: hypothetical protein V6D48_17170 [Oculatellaceae cyanobacterium]
MVTYFCRPYRSGRVRRFSLKTSIRKFKGIYSTKVELKAKIGKRSINSRLLQLSKSYLSKRIVASKLNKANVPGARKKAELLKLNRATVLVARQKLGKAYWNPEIYHPRRFQEGIRKNLKALGNYHCISFQEGANTILEASDKYDCISFQEAKKNIVLFETYNNCTGFRQDSSYMIIEKSALTDFGFVAREDNSLEEIIGGLLLLWQNSGSQRISIVFYRCLWIDSFECKSYLISSQLFFPTERFPSPSYFVI